MIRIWLVLRILAACTQQPERTLLAMQPIDDESAIVELREGRFAYLARVDRSGIEQWSSMLDGKPVSMDVQGQHIISVRYRERQHPELFELFVQAVSRTDGKVIWTTPVGLFGDEPRVEISSAVASPTMDLVVHRLSNDLLFRIDLESGGVRAELSLGVTITGMLRIEGRSLFHGRGTIVVDEWGAVHRDETAWRGCVIDDDYLFVDASRQLVRWEHGNPSREIRQLIETPQRWHGAEGCMSYRGRPVIVGTEAHSAVVQFVDAPAVTLGGYLSSSRAFHSSLEHSNLQGPATRFVPFLVDDEHLPSKKLVLVDLEQRAIAWTRAASPWREVFRVGTRWYVVDSRGTTQLTVIDGETGALTTARVSGAMAVLPHNVQQKVLWLRPDESVTLGQLDAATLRPRSLPPSIKVDVSANEL